MPENLWPYLTSSARVAAVRDTLLAIANSTNALDAFSKLVSQILKVPVAIVSLLEDQRQCYVGQAGLPAPLSEIREVTMVHSMCKYVIESQEPFLVTNAPLDPREHVREHAIVRDFGVVAYAGYPIRVSTGEIIGTLCVVDFVERAWSDWEREQLEAFSVAAIVAINSDLEAYERQAAEKRMVQMEKMNALGSLSTVIAHDFNNLLTIVSGYAGILKTKVPEDDQKYATKITDVVKKSQGLIRRLLNFSRESKEGELIIDASAVVEELGSLLAQLVGSMITCEVVITERNLRIAIDKTRMEQILMNLIVNARDALPEGGSIRVEIASQAVETPLQLHKGELAPGVYARLTVEDNGMGIPAELKEKIFSPYFTTKADDKGTGLGLATISGIVRSLKGAIDLETSPGCGTTFTIYFPLTESPSPAPV